MKKETNVDVFVGSVFKDQRTKLKYSVRYMAERLGVSSTSYYYYESGKMSMGLNTFIKTCEILGIDPDELFERSKRYIR